MKGKMEARREAPLKCGGSAQPTEASQSSSQVAQGSGLPSYDDLFISRGNLTD